MIPAASRPTQVRYGILALLTGLAVLGHFNRASLSVAGTERFIADQLLTDRQMGQIYSAFLLVYTLSMLPAGWSIDRFGPQRALSWMGLGMGGSVILTGLLGYLSLSSSGLFYGLLVCRAAAALFSAPLHPGAARAVSLWFPLPRQSFANGMVTAGALLGISGTYHLFGALLDRLDWPLAFVLCGGTMCLFALLWVVWGADEPRRHRWSNLAEQQWVASSTKLTAGNASTLTQRFIDLFRSRALVLLSLSYGALSYFQYLFFYWLEYYFETGLNLPVEASRVASTRVMLAMAAGMACGGLMADLSAQRWGLTWGRRLLALSAMLGSALFALCGAAATGPHLVTLWFALAMFALGMCEGLFWTTVTDLGGGVAGMSAAFLNTVGNGVGAMAPWLTIEIKSRWGWSAAMGFACALVALGACLWFWFDPRGQSDSKQVVDLQDG